MIYATSDIHGFPLDGFMRLLDGAGFGDGDELYVLGDVIDRNGDGGIAMLRWMMRRPNVRFLLGNHEAMLLACAFLFEDTPGEDAERLRQKRLGILSNWLYNGAEPTLHTLRDLRGRDPGEVRALLAYIRSAPLYMRVCAGGRQFLLVHAGLGGFGKDRPLDAYLPDELYWHRPSPEDRYFDDVTTILGHTPTAYYGAPRRMFVTPTWIDIDTGAASGLPPMLLRLDDMRQYYLE